MSEKLIIVGSTNEVKVSSVRKALVELSLADQYKVISCGAPSGVTEQSMTKEIALQGALNRIIRCWEQYPDAVACVGIESGIYFDSLTEKHYDFSYTIVRDKSGQDFIAKSVEFQVRSDVMELVLKGYTLGQAASAISGLKNVGHKMGLSGLVSGGCIPRSKLHTQPAIFTLARCFNIQYAS